MRLIGVSNPRKKERAKKKSNPQQKKYINEYGKVYNNDDKISPLFTTIAIHGLFLP